MKIFYDRNVTSKSAARPIPKPDIHFGSLLRRWRGVRRISQLHLALDADISTRHLSCVEAGRASREMLLRLFEPLQVSVRERNALLLVAGYAPLAATALALPASQMLKSTSGAPGTCNARTCSALRV